MLAPNGIDLGLLALDIQNPQVMRYKFRYGSTGSLEFSIEFNEDPDLPAIRFAELQFFIGKRQSYRGYITKYPGPEKKPTESWKFTGLGMGARFEKKKIALKESKDIYQIASIDITDSLVTVTTTVDLFTQDVLGCVAVVKGADNSDNDGRFDITVRTANSISFVNPAGADQALPLGLLYILPREWSDPTTKLSELITQVVTEYMGDIPILTDVSLIEESPEIITGDVLDIDGMEMSEFFAHMRILAQNYLLYVDEEKRVVFRKKSEKLVQILVIGYDFHDVQETLNEGEVVNRWFVNQKEDRSKDQPIGYRRGGVASDPTSIANYGLLESEQDVPVQYGTALCQAMAEALVQNTKEPKTTLLVKNAPFGYYELGLYKVITQPRPRDSVIHECETLTGWEWDPEAIEATIETENLIYGAGAIKLEYDFSAEGKVFLLRPNLVLMEPRRLRFWFRGNRVGQQISFCYGQDSYLENVVSFYCYTTRWRQFDVSLESFSKSKLGQIAFRIDDSGEELAAATYGAGPIGLPFAWPNRYSGLDQFYIDRISVFSTSSEHKVLELTDVQVEKGDKSVCQLTYGIREESTPEYLSKQFRSLETARLALRR